MGTISVFCVFVCQYLVQCLAQLVLSKQSWNEGTETWAVSEAYNNMGFGVRKPWLYSLLCHFLAV